MKKLLEGKEEMHNKSKDSSIVLLISVKNNMELKDH